MYWIYRTILQGMQIVNIMFLKMLGLFCPGGVQNTLRAINTLSKSVKQTFLS